MHPIRFGVKDVFLPTEGPCKACDYYIHSGYSTDQEIIDKGVYTPIYSNGTVVKWRKPKCQKEV